jgi:hypothetical protein
MRPVSRFEEALVRTALTRLDGAGDDVPVRPEHVADLQERLQLGLQVVDGRVVELAPLARLVGAQVLVGGLP